MSIIRSLIKDTCFVMMEALAPLVAEEKQHLRNPMGMSQS